MIRGNLYMVLAGLVFMSSCRKNNSENESVLYGTWVKGAFAGDTLQFMRKDNKNILRYNVSFNALQPAYTESEYSYNNGQLAVEVHGAGTILHPINSFVWKQRGEAFEIRGIELFMVMSESNVYFNYRKLE